MPMQTSTRSDNVTPVDQAKSASPRLERILVAVDDQATPATWAVQTAMRLADQYQSDLKVVHVVASTGHSPGQTSPVKKTEPDAYQRGRSVLGQLPVRTVPGRRVERTLLHGEPISHILHAARTWPADLIVVGHHSDHGAPGKPLGSVAIGVIHSAPCPVLCVSTPPGETFGKRIVVAIDFDDVSQKAVAQAVDFASRAGGELMLLHAVNMPTVLSPDFGRIRADVLHNRHCVAHKMLDSLMPGIPSVVRARRVLRDGPAEFEILAAARQWDADLIVLGIRRGDALSRLMLGSVTEAVLRQAECPVLCVGQF